MKEKTVDDLISLFRGNDLSTEGNQETNGFSLQKN
jgi:hypothetical protein